MRLFADTNIVRSAVEALRKGGHDVVYGAERPRDPGDAVLLGEAHVERRVLISKDHDIGVLVFRDGAPHAGVLLIDDLGDPDEEATLLLKVIEEHGQTLAAGAFARAGGSGVRFNAP